MLFPSLQIFSINASVVLTLDQDYFKQRVAEAKKLVPDPIQVDGHPDTPRIKLKMGAGNPEPVAQRLTLKIHGQSSETPSKDDGPSTGVTVDNESLKRQQDLVRAASTSQEVDPPRLSPRTRSLRRHIGSPKSSAATTPSASEQLHNVPTHARDPTGVIKDETPRASSQHAETRPFNGLHGLPLDSASATPPFDSKTRQKRASYLASVLTLRPTQASFQQPVDASPLDSLWRKPGQGWSPYTNPWL